MSSTHQAFRSAIAAIACACGAACSHAQPLDHNSSYGLVQTEAASVCMPAGEQLWLRRLRCKNGDPIKIVSRATVGTRHTPASPDDPRQLEQLDFGRPLRPGEPDLHLVEKFVVSCDDGDKTLFIDMYHCTENPPEVAPEGMTIEPLQLPSRD